MKLLFYQPNHSGHHLAYLGRMLPGFLETGCTIQVATTPEALQSEEYRKSLASFEQAIELIPCCTQPPQSPVQNARHREAELLRVIQECQPDHVAICYLDGLWPLFCKSALLGRRPWPRNLSVEGWLYGGRFADMKVRNLKSLIQRWLFKQFLRMNLLDRLHIDHEILFDQAKDWVRDTRSKTQLTLTPNPVTLFPLQSKAEARQALQLPDGGKWIVLSGMIAKFKGADLLLEAYRQLRDRSPENNVRLLLAGPQGEQIRAMLATEPYDKLVQDKKIVLMDRYLIEEEMFQTAAAADWVMAPYPNHPGRSSIILWAAAAGRPSLGTEEGCIGHVIRSEKLGTTCDNVSDINQLAEAIERSLTLPWTDADAARVRKYADFHRVENYQTVASDLVRSRMAQEDEDLD